MERYRLQRYGQRTKRSSDPTDRLNYMYDVIYIDAHGCETPVAQHLDDRDGRGRVARQAAAERGVGRMFLPGLDQAAQLRLRRARRRRSRLAARTAARGLPPRPAARDRTPR